MGTQIFLHIYIYIYIQNWHPNRWMKDPKVVKEAKKRFQRIQEAYSGACYNHIMLRVVNCHHSKLR